MIECVHCRAGNPEEEHRCHRCGRRLDVPRVAPHSAAVPKEVEEAPRPAPERPARAPSPQQSSLFGPPETPKVVSIRAATRGAVGKASKAAAPEAPARRANPASRPRNPILNQRVLEFLPPAPNVPKTTKTNVEAAVCCDSKVASWRYRVLASLLDAGVIAAALAVFGGYFSLRGGDFVLNPRLAPFYIGLGAAISFFYKALWAIAGRETPGMQWVHLRLLNFDGNPPDRRQRMIWFAASYLSLLAAGVGLIWSLGDEEKLTWHDHIAKTFPTVHQQRTTPLHRGI